MCGDLKIFAAWGLQGTHRQPKEAKLRKQISLNYAEQTTKEKTILEGKQYFKF